MKLSSNPNNETKTMKRISFYLVSMLVAALVAVGCTTDPTTDNPIDQATSAEKEFMTVAAELECDEQTESEESRTTLVDNNGGKVIWSEGDTIAAISADGTITECAILTIDGSVAEFSVPTDTQYAVYPYGSDITYDSDTKSIAYTLPSDYEVDGTNKVFGDKQNVMCAHLLENRLAFKNLCGYIQLQLKGSGNVKHIALRNNSANYKTDALSGLGTIALTDAENPTFTPGTNHGSTWNHAYIKPSNVPLNSAEATSFYLIVPPRSYENMAICVQTDKGSYSLCSKSIIEVNRSMIRPIQAIDIDNLKPSTSTDLSEGGVANCYIVPQGSEAKYYSFATRKINSSENIANVAYAHIIWSESAGIIDHVCYDAASERVSFKYCGGNIEGNVMISLFNSSNTSIWTYHIWCTDKPRLLAVRGGNGTTTHGILDRDLGATHALTSVAEVEGLTSSDASAALGLYYQYGRPAPFPRAKSIEVTKDDAAFGSNTAAEVIYGFKKYDQHLSWSNALNAYATNLTFPKAFYMVGYSSKLANESTYEKSNKTQYTWYGKRVYHPYDESDKLWFSENTDVVSKKSDNDPCPAGYVVDNTDGVTDYLKAFKYTKGHKGGKNCYGYYYTCPTTNNFVWIANSGYRAGTSAALSSVGENFNHWAAHSTRGSDNNLAAVRATLGYGHNADTGNPSVSATYAQLGQGFTIRCRAIDRTKLQNATIVSTTFEGDGSASSPYLIKSGADLAKLAGLCNGSMQTTENKDFTSAHYALATNIDMAEEAFNPITPFNGSFDGRGYTISNLTITPTNSTPTGLFGLTTGATIKNVTIKSGAVYVTNTTQLYTGGLVGKAIETTIDNCSFEGAVSSVCSAQHNCDGVSGNSSSVTGGLVGFAKNCTISNSSVTASIYSRGQFTAGIVGSIEGGSITKSAFSRGSLLESTMNHVGGIAGCMTFDAVISECTVDAPVVCGYAVNGGVVGRMQSGKVSRCLVSSNAVVVGCKDNATGASYDGTGGIVGKIESLGSKGTMAIVERCACYADVSANIVVGGIVGHLKGDSNTTIAEEVKECLFKGRLTVAYKNSSNYGVGGGIIGCCNMSASEGGATKVTDCAALVDGITFNSAATKAGYGGVVGYSKTTDFSRCYSNLDTATIVSEEGKCISEYTSISYYGSLYGRGNGASNGVTFTDCYYYGPRIGYEEVTATTNVESLTASQITDGTLLGKLNSANGNWKADSNGYPLPSDVPADTNPTSTVTKSRVSIIGDSISTFKGWGPNGYRYYYPISSNPTVISAAQTYWHKLIYKYMSNATLEKNIAWTGSIVARSTDASYLSSDHGAGHCFVERLRDDGVGNPDVILLHGGTNDVGNRGKSIAVHPNYPIYGASNYSTTMSPTDEEMAAVFATAATATSWDEVLKLNDTSFVEAYVKLLTMMHCKHPNAKVVMIIGDWIHEGTRQAIHKIADHYGAKWGYKCVDLQDISPYGTSKVIPKESGCHPNEAGFEVMADYIYQQVGSYID